LSLQLDADAPQTALRWQYQWLMIYVPAEVMPASVYTCKTKTKIEPKLKRKRKCQRKTKIILKNLKNTGCSLDRRSGDRSTAMHAACLVGNTAVIRRLIEAGGDLRLHDRDGKTPRDWAMRLGDTKRRQRTLDFVDWARQNALDQPASTASTSSAHVIELPTGLRTPFVPFSSLLLC